MSKYVFENIIINPTAEGIEKYIGKEVYFGDTPAACLYNANVDDCGNLGILTEIHPKFNFPFRIDRPHDDECLRSDYDYLCFIPKKEDPKPEYAPFKNCSQFLSAYSRHKGKDPENIPDHQLASLGGIWVKSAKYGFYAMVTEVYDNGVVTRPDCGIVSWGELYEVYVFPDGTPCGNRILRE